MILACRLQDVVNTSFIEYLGMLDTCQEGVDKLADSIEVKEEMIYGLIHNRPSYLTREINKLGPKEWITPQDVMLDIFLLKEISEIFSLKQGTLKRLFPNSTGKLEVKLAQHLMQSSISMHKLKYTIDEFEINEIQKFCYGTNPTWALKALESYKSSGKEFVVYTEDGGVLYDEDAYNLIKDVLLSGLVRFLFTKLF